MSWLQMLNCSPSRSSGFATRFNSCRRFRGGQMSSPGSTSDTYVLTNSDYAWGFVTASVALFFLPGTRVSEKPSTVGVDRPDLLACVRGHNRRPRRDGGPGSCKQNLISGRPSPSISSRPSSVVCVHADFVCPVISHRQ